MAQTDALAQIRREVAERHAADFHSLEEDRDYWFGRYVAFAAEVQRRTLEWLADNEFAFGQYDGKDIERRLRYLAASIGAKARER